MISPSQNQSECIAQQMLKMTYQGFLTKVVRNEQLYLNVNINKIFDGITATYLVKTRQIFLINGKNNWLQSNDLISIKIRTYVWNVGDQFISRDMKYKSYRIRHMLIEWIYLLMQVMASFRSRMVYVFYFYFRV